MAQTKRKRKHRGTAAGTVEARGRTGRPPTRSEVKSAAAARRQHRLDQPPTWGGAVNRAAIAALIFGAIAVFALGRDPAAAGVLALLAFAMYVPAGYYMDKFLYERRRRQKQR